MHVIRIAIPALILLGLSRSCCFLRLLVRHAALMCSGGNFNKFQ